jgi:hypothetical protein
VNCFWAGVFWPSAACTVKVHEPAEPGLPLRTPPTLNARPDGSEPPTSDQV